MIKFPDHQSNISYSSIIGYTALVLAASFVSYFITGFEFGIGNNVFHVPYVLNLDETPEFVDDAFYESLKYFTSIIWPLLRLVSDEANVYDVFNISHFLSRFAAFASFLFFIRTNGQKTFSSLTVCLTVAAITPWLRGYSVVGGHGMFIDYFTHSETTWTFIILSLAFLSIRRLQSSAAMAGVVFSINAFIGIWLLVACLFGALSFNKIITRAMLFRATGVFIFFAFPAIIWILFTISSNESAVHFSYIYYIRQYYPGHSLIEAENSDSLATLFLVFVTGMIAAMYLSERKFWLATQMGFLFVFVVGIPLPYLLDSRFVHNLCLLRSSGVEQLIAIILSIVAAAKLLADLSDTRKALLGVIVLVSLAVLDKGILSLLAISVAMIAGLALGQSGSADDMPDRNLSVACLARILIITSAGLFVLALFSHYSLNFSTVYAVELFVVILILALAIWRFIDHIVRLRILAILFIVLALGVSVKHAYLRDHEKPVAEAYQEDWNRLVLWIKKSDIDGAFLLPLSDGNSNRFQLEARRKVWVDWKQGAAVMWMPSFYGQWMPRFKEVLTLKSPEEFMKYAQSHGINNVILKSRNSTCPEPAVVTKSTEHYVLCQLQ